MKTSDAGRKFLEKEEGCVLHAYQDSVGVWTIGYGNTGPSVKPGLVWTQAQADDALSTRLANEFEPAVNSAGPMKQNQYDACVSLCYNIGAGGFTGSTVARDIKAGDFAGASAAFMMWVNPSELFGRRQRERAMFDGASSIPANSVTLQLTDIQKVVGVTADGVTGPATKAAIIAWQQAHGLVADGIVGPATAKAMGLM